MDAGGDRHRQARASAADRTTPGARRRQVVINDIDIEAPARRPLPTSKMGGKAVNLQRRRRPQSPFSDHARQDNGVRFGELPYRINNAATWLVIRD